MLKLKNDCKYDLVAPTSMGVRLTPDNFQPVHLSNRYTMQATSAETNVLNISASLGLSTRR
jgi:2-dehydro-3-deoxygluconokinase